MWSRTDFQWNESNSRRRDGLPQVTDSPLSVGVEVQFNSVRDGLSVRAWLLGGLHCFPTREFPVPISICSAGAGTTACVITFVVNPVRFELFGLRHKGAGRVTPSLPSPLEAARSAQACASIARPAQLPRRSSAWLAPRSLCWPQKFLGSGRSRSDLATQLVLVRDAGGKQQYRWSVRSVSPRCAPKTAA